MGVVSCHPFDVARDCRRSSGAADAASHNGNCHRSESPVSIVGDDGDEVLADPFDKV
jgi:hypothetical protein